MTYELLLTTETLENSTVGIDIANNILLETTVLIQIIYWMLFFLSSLLVYWIITSGV